MDLDNLLKFANMFCALAEGEELPDDSKDLKTVLSNLEKLETYQARKKYAERNFKHLSSGSSRIVYLTPGKTIVKLAKNDKGLAQNKAETKAALKFKNSKYLNKILSDARNYSWIEVPFVEKITEKDFKKMTGLDFSDFGESIRYSLKKISDNNDMKKPKKYDEVNKSILFKELVKIGKELDLMPGDLARISSFGCKDNCPILIDMGLTKKVFEDFYKDSSS